MTATVARLWRYPVKSMRGAPVAEVVVGSRGVLGDRAYGFVDVATGRLVSAKHPRLYGAMLQCSAVFPEPPRPAAPAPPIRVTFPDGTTTEGDEDEVARKVSRLLGRDVRLVASAPSGATYEQVWPDLEGFGPEEIADAWGVESAAPGGPGERVIAFEPGLAAPGTLLDFAPLHLVSTSSLAALAAAYPAGRWDDRRFRPNILVDDGARSDRPAEDEWVGRDLLIGNEVRIHVVSPSPRCLMVTLEQAELARDHDILRTLARVNRRRFHELGQFACLGAYAEVVDAGTVRTGDPVSVADAEPRPSAVADALALIAEGLRRGARSPSDSAQVAGGARPRVRRPPVSDRP